MRQVNIIALAVALGLVTISVAVVWWTRTSDFVARDSCLDAGGRWAEGGYCEGARYGG